jgi:hypothetical protein
VKGASWATIPHRTLSGERSRKNEAAVSHVPARRSQISWATAEASSTEFMIKRTS